MLGNTADWIKDIIKPPVDNPYGCPQIPLIAVGMYSSIKILQSNPQLDTLVTKKSYLFPYGITQEDELIYYKTFLMNVGCEIEKRYDLKIDFNDPDIYFRIFAASNGVPRLLMKLISLACGLGYSKGSVNNIDMVCFEKAFHKMYGAQKFKNPFKITSMKDISFMENTTYTTWVRSECDHAVFGKNESGLLFNVHDLAKSKGIL